MHFVALHTTTLHRDSVKRHYCQARTPERFTDSAQARSPDSYPMNRPRVREKHRAHLVLLDLDSCTGLDKRIRVVDLPTKLGGSGLLRRLDG
jgi:hypothetical protein